MGEGHARTPQLSHTSYHTQGDAGELSQHEASRTALHCDPGFTQANPALGTFSGDILARALEINPALSSLKEAFASYLEGSHPGLNARGPHPEIPNQFEQRPHVVILHQASHTGPMILVSGRKNRFHRLLAGLWDPQGARKASIRL